MNWTSLGVQLANIGLPALGTLFGGPLGGTVGAIVGKSIAAALGTEPTPEAIATVVQGNPEEVRIRLAVIEAETKARDAELRELELGLQDVAGARTMQIASLDHDGPAKWMPTVVTGLNYLFAAAVFAGVGMRWFREDGIIVGFVLGAVTSGVTFWLGSSAGSKRSADAVRSIAQAAVTPPPGKVAQQAIEAAGRGRR